MLSPMQIRKGLIDAIYPRIAIERVRSDFYRSRTILVVLNNNMAGINDIVLNILPGGGDIYLSTNMVDNVEGANDISSEFLKSLESNG